MAKYKICGFFKKTLRSVTPGQLLAYLRGKGAKKTDESPGKAAIWQYGETELLVPLATRFADYATRMAEALYTLEKLERRPQAQILADLMALPKHACRDCGAAVTGARNWYCPACAKMRVRASWRKQSQARASQRHDDPLRRCHDCGAPTPDYRCPKCRAAWRKKHDVPKYITAWGLA